MANTLKILVSLFYLAFVLPANAQYLDSVKLGEKTKYKVINGLSGSVFIWSTDNVELPSNADSIEIEWDKAGIIDLEVTEHTITGCIGETYTVQIIVEVPFDYKLKIPNTFTPNGDCLNDYFIIEDIGFSRFEISIYNRLGNLLYHCLDPNMPWNGKTNNKECTPGVYYYVLIYELNGTEQMKKGFLHLFR